MKRKVSLFLVWTICWSLVLSNCPVLVYANETPRQHTQSRGEVKSVKSNTSNTKTVSLDVSDSIIKNGGFPKGDSATTFNESEGISVSNIKKTSSNAANTAKQDLENAINNVDENCDLSEYSIPVETVSELVVEIANENPRYFYVDYDHIQCTVEDDSVTEINLAYKDTKTAVRASMAEYDAAIKEILSGVKSSWSDFEKILYINDYLASNCEYDRTYSRYSAYDIIVDKTGVCQAYAEAFQALMEELDIPCELVTSWSLNHAWNLVKVNGKYYHVDVTWNDPVPDGFGEARHYYLLKSNAFFRSSEGGHLEDDDWITSGTMSHSKATDTSYDNYFWDEVNVPFKYIDGRWYTLLEREDKIASYVCNGISLSQKQTVLTLDYVWYIWGDDYGYWLGYFGGFGAKEKELYYASPTSIYAYNVVTKKTNTVYTLSNAEQAKGYIYGLRIDADGKIEYKLATDSYEKGSISNVCCYNISFKGNGSTSGSVKALKSCLYTPTYTLPKNTFKRKGYTFTGWNTKADGSGTAYADGAKVSKLTKTNGKTIYLYAQWKKIKYTVTYDLNGGTNNKSNPSYYYVTTATKELKNPTKKGYTFKGWYSDSKYKTKVTQIKKGSTGNKKLYAKWSANKYNISFNGNGATSGKMSALKNRSYGKSYTLTKNAFKKKGYTFTGWNTKKDGSGKAYKNKASVKNLTSKTDTTVKLYAQWKKTKYTITYKISGGKNNKSNPTSYYITTATKKLKSPTRKGYTFKGWYSDSKYKKKVTEIPKGSTGNKTLYAKWSVNKYNIVFDGNGATSGKMAMLKNRSYGKSYTLKMNTYKKKGYTFAGWNTKKNGKGKSYKDKASVKSLTSKNGGTIKLYAQWKKKK